MDWKRYSLPIILMGMAFLLSCGGGGGGQDPNHFEPGNGDPGVEGNILPPPNPADIPQTGTISGALGSAPLGTDPTYEVVEASETITTRLVSGTSSVRSTSQEEDRIFWVAVVDRGGVPIEGQAVPPLAEGDDIDLYMRYQVYETELTIAREWYMEAAGLDYKEPAVVHPQAGIYEAIFPFTIPFGSAGLEAIFIGSLGTARGVSVFVPGEDMGDVRDVYLVIQETPTLPAINYPSAVDDGNDTQGGAGGCLPEYIEVTFDDTSVYVESEKDISNVVLEFDDGTHEKWEAYPPVYDDAGLLGGHFDVDTSSFISPTPPTKGSTDGHIHQYDDQYNVVGIDAFSFHSNKLHEITQDVTNSSTRFKLIVSNADLSAGGRLAINQPYDENNGASYELTTAYDNEALSALPVYSLGGVAGTTQLTDLGVYFDVLAIANGDLIPTNTGDVRKNIPGKLGEWRNGALTIQAVQVNADGTDAFTTDTSLSNGGVQGVATSGLLWECTLFWHWEGPSYHEPDWATWEPGGASSVSAAPGRQTSAPAFTTSGTFYGTNSNEEKSIVQVWVKSGCNASGEGPGYGENFKNEAYAELAMAQFSWEDLLTNGDYDYNDFTGRLRATEIRDLNNNLVQVQMTVKAVARAAGYDSDWQFNVGAAFPGNHIIAYVDQYYVNGDRHGDQRIYVSGGGMSIPIFTPIRDALPNPPGSTITNGIPGTLFIDGDYAVITVLLQDPMAQGTYTPIPYEPELRVLASNGDIYTISMWREPGDWVDSNGRPLAFIVPDTFAWPLEGRQIWTVYSGFNNWVQWINNPSTTEPSPAWYDEELADGSGAFEIGLFN